MSAFNTHTVLHLQQLKSHVETLLSINNGSYIPAIDKKTNRRRNYPPKMEWMSPIWEKSLIAINYELKLKTI